MRRRVAVFLVVGLAMVIAGCGRKDNVEPPPGTDWPRAYPSR